MEKYVTFEQAKWLKEKGMYLDGYLQDVWLGNKYEKKRGKIVEEPVFGLGSSSKLPEQWQVVEWLRINHGIWVGISCYAKNKTSLFQYEIRNNGEQYIEDIESFNSPTEAYEAAIDYIKDNNLI
jgi:hypothetical protein